MINNPLRLPAATVPAGYYAVPDPDCPTRMTAWTVDERGALHRYPNGKRWEPISPGFKQLPQSERKAAADHWYATVYRGWKIAVIGAINAAPDRATEAFTAAYPNVATDEAAERQRVATARAARLAHDLLAAALAARGTSISETARTMGTARSTARARIAVARQLATTDPGAARDILASRFALLGRESLPAGDVNPVDLDALLASIVDAPQD